MTEPLISIVIPVYNAEKYLRACLDSVLAQTYKNWEAICVNDGSSDNSAQILEEYAAKDARFHIINQQNSGVSTARNTGMRQTTGKYIYFMDADDIVSPYLFELAEKNLQNNIDCICFDYLQSNDINITFDRPKQLNLEHINHPLDELLKYKSIIHHNLWTKIFRKDIIKKLKFEPTICYGEDLYFNIQAFYLMKSVIYIPQKFYCNIKHSSSLTGSAFSTSKALGFLTINQKLFEQFKNEKFFPILRKNILNLNLKFVLKNMKKYKLNNADLYKKIQELKNCGAVNYQRLPLKIKLNLWLIGKGHK